VNLSADSLLKIGHDLSNKVVKQLKLSKNDFNKKCATKQVLFIEKIRTIQMIFDIKNSL
jgi:hypothetical protein